MNIPEIQGAIERDIATIKSEADVRAIRDRYLARKGGVISNLLKDLTALAVDERRALGSALNGLKQYTETQLDAAQKALAARPRGDAIDVTLPGRRPLVGHRHPLTLLRERVETIFQRLGFVIVEGPELEDDYHNFEALNMPAEHPARDMQDTLYLASPVPAPGGRPATLLRTLAVAVGFVHDNDLIHRDIKPANILFKADGTPKLADFGLARSVASNGKLTLEGEALGTPRFMAPEQARGDCGIGPPVDIHALGAVFYELLTGKPAFQGATKFEILYQIVHQPVTPLDRTQPNIPPELVRICMKCLEKDPARRFASGTYLAEDLDKFLEGKEQHALPQAVQEKSPIAAFPWRRIAVATVAIALIEALVIVWLIAEHFAAK